MEMKPNETQLHEPVKEPGDKPGEETESVQHNTRAGRMSVWFERPTVFPLRDYYFEGNNCPYDWQTTGQRCFKVFNQPMAWVDAEKHCWSYGTNLASIHNREEQYFIAMMIRNGRAWIGGSDAVRANEWLWSDGSAYDGGSWESWSRQMPWEKPKRCQSISQREPQFLTEWYCEENLPFVCGTRPRM
uniref:snaclec purpureotin subunit beta-like n=1 Tax=Semicossyphus pulcher TaxID=241346 RepID=UPI0037E74178